MSKQRVSAMVPAQPEPEAAVERELQRQWQRVVGRRSFLAGVGVAAAANAGTGQPHAIG
jgi:hypothetical protein